MFVGDDLPARKTAAVNDAGMVQTVLFVWSTHPIEIANYRITNGRKT
jgi:hypothetical protein